MTGVVLFRVFMANGSSVSRVVTNPYGLAPQLLVLKSRLKTFLFTSFLDNIRLCHTAAMLYLRHEF